jgi:Flp pilus assembly protein TadB
VADGLLFMAHSAAAGREGQRKPASSTRGSEQRRHAENDAEARAWSDDTGTIGRLVERWKHAVARAEHDLLRYACALALLDVMAALCGCFLPWVSPLLSIGRLVGAAVVAPAVLRALARSHADREDAELLKAITIVVSLLAVYVLVRTWIVVKVCAL